MAKATASTPTNRLTRVPYMMLDSTSRPCSSVPSKLAGTPSGMKDGGLKLSMTFRLARSNGLVGASQGENTEPTSTQNNTTAEPTANGLRRKL